MSNKPIPLQPNFANLPLELKSIPNWLLFRYMPPKRKGGKWRKVPFQPNGKTASSTRKSTWRRFDECTAAYAQGGFDGIGFVFDGEIGTDGLCYCGVDFDDCVVGTTVHSLALARMRGLDTYTERSVSGTGFHCIARAKPLDRIVKFDGVEVYTTARYFVCTGLSTGTIKAAPTEVRALVDEVRAKEVAAKKQKSNHPQSEGIETTRWFENLSEELKDEVVDCALGVIAKNTRLLELEANGGNNADYFKLTTSVARSGAPHAEDIFVKHAAGAKDADPEDELRRYFGRCGASSPSGDQPITVGTLLSLAQQSGANFDAWAQQNKQQQQTITEPSFVDPYDEFVGPEFPLDILPPALANFVNAEHRAMGADPSAIAMAALTALAGAMHAETRVRVGEGWWEKPIIWTALLGLPSTMKSPIIDKSTKPLSLINHERDNRWRTEYAKWKQIPNNKTIPSPPKPARSVINDATAEKVAELLSRDPSGSLLVQDELAGWLGGFERYNAGQSQRAFYLTAWNGGTFLKDRVGKGKTDQDAEIRVENLALSILGGIQPDRLTKLGDLTSDGLLQRFLAVLMKPAKLGDPYYPVAGAEAEYEKLIRSISNLPAQNYHFVDEAFEVRDDVLGYLHKLEQVDGFPPSLIGAIGKLNGYFARICLVLHIARHHDAMMGNAGQSEPLHSSFTGGAGEYLRKLFGLPLNDCLSAGIATSSAISRETAEAAKKLLLEFLLPHMIGLYDVVVNGGQERDKLQFIANFILASDKDRIRRSDFMAGVRCLRGEPEQKIREWAGRFCSMDWLLPEEEKPGVPTKAWQVFPGLRDHFTERRKQVQAARAEMPAILKAGGSSRSR